MNNLNTWDRLIRALLGLVALELAFFWLAGGLQMAAHVVGAVLLVTALIRFCPLYKLAGIGTSGIKKGFGKGMGAFAILCWWRCWLVAAMRASSSRASCSLKTST